MQILRSRISSRWRVPVVALAAGLAMLGAQWSAGYPGRGFVSLAILGAFAAALVLFSGRSGTVEVMRDPAWTSAQRCSICARRRLPPSS